MYPGERTIHKSRDEFGDLVVTESNLLRTLYFGNEKRQSAMFLRHSSLLALEYTQVMMLSLLFQRHPNRIFCLGLGGGSIMKFLLRACPRANIDVVELRQRVIDIAHGFFDVPEKHPLLKIVHADGADYFRHNDELVLYDLILLDGYDHCGPVESVNNLRFLSSIKSRLSENGVMCINLWNRPGDNFHQRYRQLSALFHGGVLRLELGKKNSNVSVFCFNNASMMKSLSRYQGRARELQGSFGINFQKYLSRLYKQNVPMLKRLAEAVY